MTFLLIVIIVIICWPWISKWIKGFMSRRAEDAIRRMMGMPSRKEEQRRRKEQSNSNTNRRRDKAKSTQTPAQEREADRKEALRSMKENAVDVEYTEYREFSQTEIAVEDGEGNKRVCTESQVTDVEYIEIREADNQKK